MNFDDVLTKYSKKNKILFRQNSDCLIQLRSKLQACNKRVIVVWALDCAREAVIDFSLLYPNEPRAAIAIDSCEKWAFGDTKMTQAKQAILNLHAAAKESDDIVFQSYCHAIAQAGSCVHSIKHAMGLVMYELSALVFKQGVNNFIESITSKIVFYESRIDYWKANEESEKRDWALFMKERENKHHE